MQRFIPHPGFIPVFLFLLAGFGRASARQERQDDTLYHPQYYLLGEYFKKYKTISVLGGWPLIRKGDTLKAGMRNERVRQLRGRLAVTGELAAIPGAVSDSFDTELENAVKLFQGKNGIPPSGLIDKRTLQALNVPVEKRIRQIEVNRERWKNISRIEKENFILVNTADFRLEVREEDSLVMSMKIIVGRQYRKTPVFSAYITYLDFNPYWYIPPGILTRDIVPKILDDTSFLRKMNMHVFELAEDGSLKKEINPASVHWNEIDPGNMNYQVIQSPGPSNPLGTVKFMFPNKYKVYLHDTPDKKLFEKDRPAFSSGCIRVSKATELAVYLLKKDKGWDEVKIDSITRAGKTYRVYLQKPLHIYITYFTAWVDKLGGLNFREDIYGRDE